MSNITIDENGLTVETLAQMIETAKEDFRAAFGDNARVDVSDSPEGQTCRILAEIKNSLAEHLQAAVSGLLPSKSAGALLKESIKFNGLEQNNKEYSTATVTVTANEYGTELYAGDLVQTPAGAEFALDTGVVLLPSESDDVGVTATTAGPITADAGAITVIATPRRGWASVTNAAKASIGNLDETDPQMRARRWRAAVGVGLHHESKIRAALENLPGVTAASVEINKDLVTNSHGVPPGHVRCIVRGGEDQDIADCLFGSYAPYNGAGSLAAGIVSFGATSVAVTGEGQSGTMYFDRSIDKNIYIKVRTRKDAKLYPANGDAQIRSFIKEFFAGDLEIEGGIVTPPGLGDTVYGTDCTAAARAVPGHKIESVLVGFSASPTEEFVELDAHEFPVTDDDLITVQGV